MTVLASLLAACSPISLLNSLTPSSSYRETAGLAYGTDPRQKLDIFSPIGATDKPSARQNYPVVVFFYGGSWNRGERSDYRFVAEALAARGIVTVLVDYRLYPQVRYPDFLKDCAKALAWTQRDISGYGGDPQRLFVMGHSAGAYNAAMLALDPRWLASEGLSPAMLSGWIGLAGPYDFLPITNPDAKPVFFDPHYPEGSQPIDYVSRLSPPAFLGAATSDELVNPERNTKQLASKFQSEGVPVTIKLYPRVNHLTLIGAFAWPLRWLAPVADDVAQFVTARSLTSR
jgi:acetyl esterase/lipase